MRNYRMLIVLLGIIGLSPLVAQRNFYLYLQTENHRPFMVTLNAANTYGSDANGYIIIPQLKDTVYQLQLQVGDVEKVFQFTIAMNGSDRGFSLKWGVDNGWTLFDLVNFELISGREVKREKVLEPAPIVPVTEEPVVLQQEKAIPSNNNIAKQPEMAPVKVKKALPLVHKLYEKAGNDGIDQVFMVDDGVKKDTVILFVPLLKPKNPAGNGSGSAVIVKGQQWAWYQHSELFSRND